MSDEKPKGELQITIKHDLNSTPEHEADGFWIRCPNPRADCQRGLVGKSDGSKVECPNCGYEFVVVGHD